MCVKMKSPEGFPSGLVPAYRRYGLVCRPIPYPTPKLEGRISARPHRPWFREIVAAQARRRAPHTRRRHARLLRHCPAIAQGLTA